MIVVKFNNKEIGKVESFEIGDKIYPKIKELDLKDGYSFSSGKSGSFPIVNGESVGSNNHNK